MALGALDNTDQHPSSTTSSFHGTGISIFQFPTEDKPGQDRPVLTVPPLANERHSLPDSYTTVLPVEMNSRTIKIPERRVAPIDSTVNIAVLQEYRWVEHVLGNLNKPCVNSDDTLTWSSYHSSNDALPRVHPAVTSLLPLFNDKAATPAMIKHGMTVIRDAITFLNPGQVPVIALDQPLFALFALAKQVQWKWPMTHGEDKYVVMFGGLHIEMALWNTLGDLLEGSLGENKSRSLPVFHTLTGCDTTSAFLEKASYQHGILGIYFQS